MNIMQKLVFVHPPREGATAQDGVSPANVETRKRYVR